MVKFGPRKRFAAVASVLAVATLVLVAVFLGQAALLLLVGVLQVLLIAGIAAAFVELDRRRRRSDTRRDERLRGAVEALRTELTGALESQGSEVVERASEHVTAEVDGLRGSLERVERRLMKRARVDFEQVEALLGLYTELQPERALPATRGWAASPDLLLTCWELALRERPSVIVECGSGVSTLVFAYACRRNGRGRVVSLDHDEEFALRTRRLLTEHGLEQWAEVRTAPLEPLEGTGKVWYRTSQVPDGPIDLLLIDGPPAGRQPDAREPALDVLYGHLSPRATVVVDDHDRERGVVDGWIEQHPELELERRRHEKGTAVLRRRPSEALLPPVASATARTSSS